MSALEELPWLPLEVHLSNEDRAKLRRVCGPGTTKWDEAAVVQQVVHEWLVPITVAG